MPAPQEVKSNICEAVFAVFGVTQEGIVSHKKLDPGLAPDRAHRLLQYRITVQMNGLAAAMEGVG